MGLFLAATAVRDASVVDVAAEIGAWCSDHFVVCSRTADPDAAPPEVRIDVVEPIQGWTMVMWPWNFLSYEEVAEHLSATLDTVVSAVSVYDSDCWQQVTAVGGEVVDRYATDPRYLTSDLEPLSVVAPRWKGDPDVVARLLGCDSRDVARHYRRNRRGRTFSDWGFVELWADEGITYPEPSNSELGATLALGDDWANVLQRLRHG